MDGTEEDALATLTDLVGDTLDAYAEQYGQARIDDEAVAELTDAILLQWTLVPREAHSAFELDHEDLLLVNIHRDGSRCMTPITCPSAWSSLKAMWGTPDD